MAQSKKNKVLLLVSFLYICQNYLNHKLMKIRNFKLLFVVVAFALMFQSCATVFGGHISECQRTKPAPGQPTREIRPTVRIFDGYTRNLL